MLVKKARPRQRQLAKHSLDPPLLVPGGAQQSKRSWLKTYGLNRGHLSLEPRRIKNRPRWRLHKTTTTLVGVSSRAPDAYQRPSTLESTQTQAPTLRRVQDVPATRRQSTTRQKQKRPPRTRLLRSLQKIAQPRTPGTSSDRRHINKSGGKSSDLRPPQLGKLLAVTHRTTRSAQSASPANAQTRTQQQLLKTKRPVKRQRQRAQTKVSPA